ncbi:TetR/AcrR family transcriptional regulator [Streptomyces sp. WMMC500]|uniref:TetR/AcrR family transcriptional regulator n=1 Tax=Streptomyces sp. WMMC500 TaxID=3015154 RepID=UPI00248CAFA7|nr:TetR/AcrR family transcriptional regulator [Streptomyces sp. WMMC500]WBB58085.1 TetR/AcrR family transcriptional regulator [Streptomyces sp. WMMC500]
MRTVNPEQHARKRARILAAAAEEFAANGVDGTSTARICRRAGIGSGTLFHYFPTKKAIFHALFADDLARTAEIRDRALAVDDPAEGFALLFDRLAADLADPLTPGLAAAALLQANRDATFAALLGDDEARTLAALTTLLHRLAAQGRHPAFPPARAARWLVTVIDAAYLAATDDGYDPQAHAAELREVTAWLTGGPIRTG